MLAGAFRSSRDMEGYMKRKALYIIFLLAVVLSPFIAEARCYKWHPCWRQNGYDRTYGDEYSRPHRNRGYVYGRVFVQQDVVREPGVIDYVIAPPLVVLDTVFGILFGRTKAVGPARDRFGNIICNDDDKNCHRERGVEAGRRDARSEVADATEDRMYRDGYNRVIRDANDNPPEVEE